MAMLYGAKGFKPGPKTRRLSVSFTLNDDANRNLTEIIIINALILKSIKRKEISNTDRVSETYQNWTLLGGRIYESCTYNILVGRGRERDRERWKGREGWSKP